MAKGGGMEWGSYMFPTTGEEVALGFRVNFRDVLIMKKCFRVPLDTVMFRSISPKSKGCPPPSLKDFPKANNI